MNDKMNRSIKRSHAASEIFQIVSAGAFALLVSRIPTDQKLAIVVPVALIFLLSAFAAGVIARRHEARASAEASVVKHVINQQRLDTLSEVGVGADILKPLATRTGESISSHELTTWLRDTVGHARADEKLHLVLRYTRATA